MNPQNDMRRYVMQAMQQHGGLSPRFQGLAAGDAGAELRLWLLLSLTPIHLAACRKAIRALLKSRPNGAHKRRLGLDAQRQRGMQSKALMQMDRGDLD